MKFFDYLMIGAALSWVCFLILFAPASPSDYAIELEPITVPAEETVHCFELPGETWPFLPVEECGTVRAWAEAARASRNLVLACVEDDRSTILQDR